MHYIAIVLRRVACLPPGSDDKLVPPAMMRRLSTAATGSKKKAFVTVEGGDHNDTFQKGVVCVNARNATIFFN